MDAKSQFDELKLSQVIENAEKVTSWSFQEAAAEALKKITLLAASTLLSHPVAKPSMSGVPSHSRKPFMKAVPQPPQPDPYCPSH